MNCPRDAHGFCEFWSLGASSCRGETCSRKDRSPEALERIRQRRIRDLTTQPKDRKMDVSDIATISLKMEN